MTEEQPPYAIGSYNGQPAAINMKTKKVEYYGWNTAMVESFVRDMNNYSAKLDRQGRKATAGKAFHR